MGRKGAKGILSENGSAVQRLLIEHKEGSLVIKLEEGSSESEASIEPEGGKTLASWEHPVRIRFINCLLTWSDRGTLKKEGNDTVVILQAKDQEVNCKF